MPLSGSSGVGIEPEPHALQVQALLPELKDPSLLAKVVADSSTSRCGPATTRGDSECCITFSQHYSVSLRTIVALPSMRKHPTLLISVF